MDILDGIKKFSKRTTLDRNRLRGKWSEERYKVVMSPTHQVKRTGKESDFKIRKRNLMTGKSKGPYQYVELKSSTTARVSPLQKKTAKRLGNRFKIVRL